jgi:hypothetical protein
VTLDDDKHFVKKTRARTYHRITWNKIEYVFDSTENEDLRGRYHNPNQECSKTGQQLSKVSMEGEECARIIESTHGREVSVITNADKGAGVEGEEGRTVATVGTTFLYD